MVQKIGGKYEVVNIRYENSKQDINERDLIQNIHQYGSESEESAITV